MVDREVSECVVDESNQPQGISTSRTPKAEVETRQTRYLRFNKYRIGKRRTEFDVVIHESQRGAWTKALEPSIES